MRLIEQEGKQQKPKAVSAACPQTIDVIVISMTVLQVRFFLFKDKIKPKVISKKVRF